MSERGGMAHAADLKSANHDHAGSSPTARTRCKAPVRKRNDEYRFVADLCLRQATHNGYCWQHSGMALIAAAAHAMINPQR